MNAAGKLKSECSLLPNMIYYSKFAKHQFFDLMSALPRYKCFQISGTSMLDIYSCIKFKSFTVFPYSIFLKHVSEN